MEQSNSTTTAGANLRLVDTKEAHEATGITEWSLAAGARRRAFPAGVVVRIGRRVYWNLDKLRAHLEAGGDLAVTR